MFYDVLYWYLVDWRGVEGMELWGYRGTRGEGGEEEASKKGGYAAATGRSRFAGKPSIQPLYLWFSLSICLSIFLSSFSFFIDENLYLHICIHDKISTFLSIYHSLNPSTPPIYPFIHLSIVEWMRARRGNLIFRVQISSSHLSPICQKPIDIGVSAISR